MIEKKLFIHIPKNGGTTIRNQLKQKLILVVNNSELKKFLSIKYIDELNFVIQQILGSPKRNGAKHARWQDINPEITKCYHAVAIIRNPWSRIVSQYTYGKQISFIDNSMTFDKFLEGRYKYADLPYYWHRAINNWYQQQDYVVDSNNKLKCDILRFEYYNDDVIKYFNLSKPLNIHNSSNIILKNKRNIECYKNKYQTFYTEETKQIIADWYKDDIDFFGFTFNGSATKNIWNQE